jgi:3-methyladenine DNA glycosylase AlkD
MDVNHDRMHIMTAAELKEKLLALADPAQARHLQRYFKTGPGEYGEGDRFLGVRVPQIRKLAREGRDTPISEVRKLLNSPIHEERLLALLLLVQLYQHATGEERGSIYRLYLDSSRYINNWDLVDTTAKHIVGDWLFGRSRQPLYQLARSGSVWERRIAILATFHFIAHGEVQESLRLAGVLVGDEHELIHKALGWMLREVGKCNRSAEEEFLKAHYQGMPRTMLRYAIEHFPEKKRQAYLKGRV